MMCEPLMFDVCEKHLDQAEKIYEERKELFSAHDKLKFLMKKSSYLKKYGFFHEAQEILVNTQN